LSVTTTLLKTKLNIPKLRSNLIFRQDIINLLEKGLTKKLTYISASPGFGKTTILVQWLNSFKHKAAWLSLDKGDNNPSRFFSYLISALQNIKNNFGNELIHLLDLPEKPQLEHLVSLLIYEMEDITDDFIIILDDYQTIIEPEIHESLAFLLENAPTNLHVYITSRFEPIFTNISKLRAQNNLNEIKSGKLRFGLPEIKEFFSQTGIKLTDEEVKIFEKKTEGWGLSLQLALISMQESESISTFIKDFKGNDRYIVDYLLDEILNNLTLSLQDFLLETSILLRFNASLCNYLTGNTDSQSIIYELERKNFFIIPIDNKREWYRYHNLFSDLLYDRLKKNKPESLTGLHLKAAGWYEKNGFIHDAVIHALAAGDQEYSAILIDKIIVTMMSHWEIPTLTSWFSQISEDVILGKPRLFVYYGCILVQNGKFKEAELLIEKGKKLYQGQKTKDDFPLFSQLANLSATVAFEKGEFGLMIDYSKMALENMETDDPSVCGPTHFNLGVVYMQNGEFNKSIDNFYRSTPYNLENGDTRTALTAGICIGRILILQGNIYEGENQFKKVIHESEKYKLNLHTILGTVFIDLARTNYYQDRLAESGINIGKAISLAGQSINAPYVYITMFEIKSGNSDPQYQKDLIEEIEKIINADFFTINDKYKLQAIKAKLLLSLNLSGQIEIWAGDTLNRIEKNFSYSNYFEIITLARFYLSQGKFSEALQITDKLFEIVELLGLKSIMIKVLILQSLIYDKKAEQFNAVIKLKSALILAHKQGFFRVFIDEPDLNSSLIVKSLEELKKEKITLTSGFQENLLNKIIVERGEINKNNLLSEREMEIIKLIEEGLSNPEIGDKLFISLNTIKTHLKNIFRKLDVQNRTQAIVQAKKINLL
jgi:LuxR family maltose regulon positive regulatory protein